MRIQHNIMAMNAYRNYNNNNKALSGNLEKLSSGYKINRAGDDAAGLAISEKMRAQITGLNAAQKNVKDGISLVKTAEGAMQEIQDMLNRMDYLATQSANGTYDNEVDRANLQKEVNALKTEINRIADSANFNGIKLLDGSLDEAKKAIDASETTNTTVIDTNETVKMQVGSALPEVGQVLGTDTIVHKTALNSNEGTKFGVDLHNFEFKNQEGNSMTIQVGDTKITMTAVSVAADADDLSGDDLIDKILAGSDSGEYEVTVNGKAYYNGDTISINGQEFEVEKNPNTADKTSSMITFTQKNPPKDKSEEVNGSMAVKVTGDVAAVKGKYEILFDESKIGAITAGATFTIGSGRDAEVVTFKKGQTLEEAFADLKNYTASVTYSGTLGGANAKVTVTLTAKNAGAMEKPEIKYVSKTSDISAATTVGSVMGTAASGTVTVSAGGTTKLNGEVIGANGATSGTTADGKFKWELAANGTTVTVTAVNVGLDANDQKFKVTCTTGSGASEKTHNSTLTLANGTASTQASAAYNVSTLKPGGTLTIGEGESAYTMDYKTLQGLKDGGALTVEANGTRYNLTYNGTNLTVKDMSEVTRDNEGKVLDDGLVKVTNQAEPKVSEKTKGEDAKLDGMDGDYNVSTTVIQQVSSPTDERIASTYFDLTEDMVKEGSVLKIGEKEYTFTANATKTTDIDISSGDLVTIAQKLTEAAGGIDKTTGVADMTNANKTWTVGHDGTRISLTETDANAKLYDATGKFTGTNDQYDLSTKEGIEASLGFKGVKYEVSETIKTEAVEGGKPLSLQIGDTSESFNQMKVSVGDMHTKAMTYTDEETGESASIEDIDISNQEGAAKAVDVIKNAINYVSSVRGDLGAIQNRLEHTTNNLSVMAENIQDAESTIRDTDVAEEMMSYVKNNILVQSAQAMLAQANQVPQGVLQLLG